MSRKLLKSTLVVGGMTLLSRISGLVRDIIFAYVMGSGLVADAFFVAFRIPNFFRRIFAEGAFAQAFVPVYAEYREKRPREDTQRFLDHMAGRLGGVLVLITVAGIWAAPALVTVIAPGFLDRPDKFQLTVDALRITFPYLLCISLVAMAGGILNSCGRFAAPAVTPVLLNLFLIAAALWLTPVTGNAALALAVGVLMAGVAQLLFQLPFLAREGALPRPRVRGGDEGVKRVFRLMLPAVFGASVAQINILVGTLLASFLVTGSVSWLYYADRVMEFPLGVFGIALATVMLPTLSRLHARTDGSAFSDLLDWSLRWVFLIATPACVGLMVMAEPIISTLFQHGATTPDDVRRMAHALVAFAFGLLGFVLVKVLAPGFFARQDTRTPVRVAVVAVVVNIIMSLLLVWPLAHVGLALATSLAAWANAALLWRLLRERGIYRPAADWSVFLLKVLTAALSMGALLWFGAGDSDSWRVAGVLERAGRLALWITLGAGAYFLVILVLGIRPRQLILKKADFET